MIIHAKWYHSLASTRTYARTRTHAHITVMNTLWTLLYMRDAQPFWKLAHKIWPNLPKWFSYTPIWRFLLLVYLLVINGSFFGNICSSYPRVTFSLLSIQAKLFCRILTSASQSNPPFAQFLIVFAFFVVVIVIIALSRYFPLAYFTLGFVLLSV